MHPHSELHSSPWNAGGQNVRVTTPTGAHPGHAVLQVPVPAMEDWVRARTAHYDAAYLSDDPSFVHAHVTALGPFTPCSDGTLHAVDADAVGAAAARQQRFEFTLEKVDTFPTGIIHLLPAPAEPFSKITDALRTAFPDVLPYGGEFVPVPHLTLDLAHSDVTQESTWSTVQHLTPVRDTARHLDLAWYEPGRCRLLARWELGTGSRLL